MAITLSHHSAFEVTRSLRTEGVDLKESDATRLTPPTTWVGKRWTMREFDPSVWEWEPPQKGAPLHILHPQREGRVRMSNVCSHAQWNELPPNSVLRVGENSLMVCPELLFLQMAETLSFPHLVMLGYELCGNFTFGPSGSASDEVKTWVATATDVVSVQEYLNSFGKAPGLIKARRAIQFVCDHAVSAMEAVIAAMYSLSPEESGYGMGPLTLNERVLIDNDTDEQNGRSRFPDLMFPFAPIGINYDGDGHLDLKGLVDAAIATTTGTDTQESARLRTDLAKKLEEVRAKTVDDRARDRQLASTGRLVLPMTKENVYESDKLDEFTGDLLACARSLFGADTEMYERILNDTDKARDRYDLLLALLQYS